LTAASARHGTAVARETDMTPRISTTLPGFFGRMPLLLSEQKRFAAVRDSLRELCAALNAGVETLPARLDPPQLVEELGGLLADHFEGADECLRAVAARRHDLLPAVVDMRADHAAFSEALADLRVLAADPMRWVELPLRIASMLEKLEVHREGEAALIHDAAQAANVA